MIKYQIGNLLTTNDPTIVHGCNAQGVMGSGVARQIREQWPGCYELYKQCIDEWVVFNGSYSSALGKIFVFSDNKITIINAITQQFYGRNKQKYVSYDAIDECMKRTYDVIDDPRISMPLIGCGLGGGRWPVVESIVRHRLKGCDVTVWIHGKTRVDELIDSGFTISL